jgi:Fic family protein
MARTTGANAKTSPQELPEVPDLDEPVDAKDSQPESHLESQPETLVETVAETLDKAQKGDDIQTVDDILNSLKALLSAVEKLQKIRQEVGDIKPLLMRMLDGELVSGEEMEQLKTGVSGLLRLVRAYGDHQAALAKAQTARSLLDEVLKVTPSRGDE